MLDLNIARSGPLQLHDIRGPHRFGRVFTRQRDGAESIACAGLDPGAASQPGDQSGAVIPLAVLEAGAFRDTTEPRHRDKRFRHELDHEASGLNVL